MMHKHEYAIIYNLIAHRQRHKAACRVALAAQAAELSSGETGGAAAVGVRTARTEDDNKKKNMKAVAAPNQK